ncbi:MAG: hypothetical protein P9X24_16540 [Candidatus Hatepunaea meridiana]|nr:hypothetical protein [Candidatus Hatepunaea meridiana]
MAIGNSVKIDRAWKLALDRALTSTGKEFFEEQYSTGRIVHADDVWKEIIDSDPAQAVNDSVAQLYQELVLEEDLSVAGKKAWIAKSGGVRLQDWISPRFGQGYTIQLFDQDGNQIFTTDPCNWVFDYKAGILILENSHASATGFKITGYRYVGEKGVGGDPQDFQGAYDAGNINAEVKLDANGSLLIKASDNTPLLEVDEANKQVTLKDLVVEGKVTKVETTDTEVKDNILTLNKQESGQTPPSGFTSGIEIDRGASVTRPTLRWNNQTKKWQVSFDDDNFFDLATEDQIPGYTAVRKYVETIVTPSLTVMINDIGNKVNIPGCTLQIFEDITGQLEQVEAEVIWASDWSSVTINFEENFVGKIVLMG